MRNLILALALVTLVPGCAGQHWQPWSGRDVFLGLVDGSLQAIDCGQTLAIVATPGQHEMNPVMGSHPSRDEVWWYMASSLLLKNLVTWWLDPHDRPAWQGACAAVSLWAVTNNMDEQLSTDF